MGVRKTHSEKPRARLRATIQSLALLLALLLAWMLVEASVVRLELVELPLADLPAEFDGVTVLFLSDLHITSINSPARAIGLLRQLCQARPDLLILGGDYTSFDLAARLGAQDAQGAYAREADLRDEFFAALSEFNFPLGKYGVAGEADRQLEARTGRSLAQSMALGGVVLLSDEADHVALGGARLLLVGLDDWREGAQDVRGPAAEVSQADCALVISHNPDCLFSVLNQPGQDGGCWADAILAGHTHGGQFLLFGHPLLQSSIYGDRFLRGWYHENGVWLLVSGGVSSNLIPLRFLSPPQAHLVTLRVP